jgi:hypothetical protein
MVKILEHVIVKLFGVIDGDCSCNTEAADNVLPDKFLDGHSTYVGHQLCLNPLCEILDCYNGKGLTVLS